LILSIVLLLFLLFETVFAAYSARISPFGRFHPALCGTDPQVSHSNQIVSRYCQGKVPIDLLDTSVTSLAEQANSLEPAEDLVDSIRKCTT
jgi:hypothetical protein